MTTTKLTQPGEAHTAQCGDITLVASLTVDGGVALNTFAGPTRVNELSGLTFMNRLDAAEVYGDIRDGGLAYMTLADIAEKVRERLVDIAAGLRGRAGYEPRVDELDRNLDRVEPLAMADLLGFAATVGDAVAAGVTDAGRPRTLADLRDEFAAGMARGRATAAA